MGYDTITSFFQVNPVYPWRRVLRNTDSPDGASSLNGAASLNGAIVESTMELEEEEEEDRFLSEDLLAFHRGNDVKEFAFDRMMKRQDEDDLGKIACR